MGLAAGTRVGPQEIESLRGAGPWTREGAGT